MDDLGQTCVLAEATARAVMKSEDIIFVFYCLSEKAVAEMLVAARIRPGNPFLK